jgi:hypothetical protein
MAMKRLYANGWTGDIRALTHAGSRQLLSPNVPEQHVTGGVRGAQRAEATGTFEIRHALIVNRFSFLKMALKLETINIPHLPASLPVHVALYRNVQNSALLRQQLLAGNAEFEYALIDASLVRAYEFVVYVDRHWISNQEIQVLSRAHALAAIFRAMNDYMNHRLKSHNVHSEIVFSFNPTNNVW